MLAVTGKRSDILDLIMNTAAIYPYIGNNEVRSCCCIKMTQTGKRKNIKQTYEKFYTLHDCLRVYTKLSNHHGNFKTKEA